MSTIFISHNSSDNAFAQKVVDFLIQRGHKSVFLDFDPEHGIIAGRNWEKELYSKLRSSRVVIILYSKSFAASLWCFAEITHAKALGKHIIPVKIDDCSVSSILTDVQVIDATTDVEDAFSRLEKGLNDAGIMKESWDHSRPPYPGLLAFQEEDAPVFFGRGLETENLLKSLRQFRSFGGPKLLLVIGPSGSGKSSLIRAGVIPQLHKDKKAWIIIGPFRPLKNPFKELSKAIAKAFDGFPKSRDSGDIYQLLIDDSNNPFGSGNALSELLTELITASNQSDAVVLLFIDQLEELFTYSDDRNNEAKGTTANHAFLNYLRHFLDHTGTRILNIGTLRSDFLGNFQAANTLKGLPFDDYIVKSVTIEGLKDSITQPARIAGVELEEGLADMMLEDTRTPDALPLLAFTLRELWEQYGHDGLLTKDEYKNKLGGLEGSVARVAEAVLMAHIAETGRGELTNTKNETKATLNNEDEVLLKAAFMAMVRIDEEGRFTKKFAAWNEFPPQIAGLLQRFVSARLLTASGDGTEPKLEVAHEALFRTWTRLVNWLGEDKNFLLWRKRLTTAVEEWERSEKNESELLRGPVLGESIQWLNQHKAKKYNLTSGEVHFIQASQDAAEKQRRKKIRNLRILSTVAFIVVIVIAVLYYKNYQAGINTQNQLARIYWNNSQTARDGNNLLAALHFDSEAIHTSKNRDLSENLFLDAKDFFSEIWMKQATINHKGIWGAFLYGSGKFILSWGGDGNVRRWDLETGQQISPPMKHRGEILFVVFNSQGDKFLTCSEDSTARLWSVETGEQIGPPLIHGGTVYQAIFNKDGSKILTCSLDSTVRLWQMATGKQLGPSLKHNAGVFTATFSSDEKRILTWCKDRTAHIWDVDRAVQVGAPMMHRAKIPPSFNVAETQILTVAHDSTAQLWEAATGKPLGPPMKHSDRIGGAIFSKDGNRILTWGTDGTARLWETGTGKQLAPSMRHDHPWVSGAQFSSDEQNILTWSFDHTARLWHTESGNQIGASMMHGSILEGATFSADGKLILTWGDDETARLWENGTGKEICLPMKHNGDVEYATFSPDNKQILTWCKDGEVSVWRRSVIQESLSVTSIKNRLITGIKLSSDGRQFLAWGNDTVRIHQTVTGAEVGAPMSHNSWVLGAIFSADEKLILTWGGDSTARIWDAATGKQVLSLMHDMPVRNAIFSDDEKKISTWSWHHDRRSNTSRKEDRSGSLRVWDAKTGKQIGSTSNHYGGYDARFAPDGNNILIPGPDGEIQFWNLLPAPKLKFSMTRERIREGVTGDDFDAVINDKGKQILSWGYDQTVRLWNMETGVQIGPALNHANSVEAADFDKEYKRILTCSQDSTARLWKPGTGEQLGQPMKHPTQLKGGMFSADDKRIFTWGFDNVVRIWETSTGKQINLSALNVYEAEGAAITRDKKQLLIFTPDSIAIVNLGDMDLDIPPSLFKLQAQVFTGLKLNAEANILTVIPPEEWYKLKKDYQTKARQHYKVCKHPNQNLWMRFFPEEAKQAR